MSTMKEIDDRIEELKAVGLQERELVIYVNNKILMQLEREFKSLPWRAEITYEEAKLNGIPLIVDDCVTSFFIKRKSDKGWPLYRKEWSSI